MLHLPFTISSCESGPVNLIMTIISHCVTFLQAFFIGSAVIKHPLFLWYSPVNFYYVTMLFTVEKKKETITESAGRQQKKKIGKMRY